MLDSARILVVDDEKMIREGCARILGKAGHIVISVADGQSALDIIRKEPFDIVLLDIKMPLLDGMQVMGILQLEKPDLLVLVITGYATIETAVNAMKAGAYDLLIKPFSADALRIAVGRALDHLRLASEMEKLKLQQARSLRDIAQEQSRMRTIMNSMACGILVTDNEKHVVLFNPLAPRMLNVEKTSILGEPANEVIPQKELVDMVNLIFEEGEEYTAVEHEIQIKDDMWVRARAAPVRDNDANILGAVTVLQDITHMKQLERMKSEWVTMVSHELKAPLAAIQQHVEVLLAGMVGDLNERQSHFLGRAKDRAENLIALIDQMLDISRIEAGAMVSEQGPVDLVPIIYHVIDLLISQAENKQQELIINLPAFLPEISADPRNMDEVFLNVINNAIKYTPEGGQIKVSAGVAGDHVQVTVSDTGYGIPKDDIPKIFDKFFRVKTDKTKSITGTGLGLPIVQGIVEAHLGSIDVQSEFGAGTTFTIKLPLLTSTDRLEDRAGSG